MLAYTVFNMQQLVVVSNLSQKHLQMLFCLEWEMAKKPDLISLGFAYTVFCMLQFVIVANISQKLLQMLFCVSLEWEIAKEPFKITFHRSVYKCVWLKSQILHL